MKNILLIVIILFCQNINSAICAHQLNNSLSKQQKSLVRISVYAARGDLQNLNIAVNNGLDEGLPINVIKEALLHMYAYAGFPRSIRGLQTLMDVIAAREIKGKKDSLGVEASVIIDERTKYERGKEILKELTGIEENDIKTGYAAFAPTIEIFLKEHLFADLFERDVLTYQERELVTISVLSSITGVEPMLRSHFTICLNLGFTADQLQEFITILQGTIADKDAQKAEEVLLEVLKNKK